MSSEHTSHLPTRLEPGFITTPDGRYPVLLGDVNVLPKNRKILVVTYATLEEYGCDFAAIFMPRGESTPLQVKHGKIGRISS
jgi:hypothetical protein